MSECAMDLLGSMPKWSPPMSAIETQDAALAARIEVQAHMVADLDRRLGQIDTATLGIDSIGPSSDSTTTLALPIRCLGQLLQGRGPLRGPLDHQPKRSPERLLGQRKHVDRVAAAHGVCLRRNAQRAGI